MEEAEATLEQEENKVSQVQDGIQSGEDWDWASLLLKKMRSLQWSENQAKALDISMQAALETEAKGQGWSPQNEKKLEADAADLGLALEHAIAGNAETQNTIKKYQLQVRDAQIKVDEESAAPM